MSAGRASDRPASPPADLERLADALARLLLSAYERSIADPPDGTSNEVVAVPAATTSGTEGR